jgi:ribonuclease PH
MTKPRRADGRKALELRPVSMDCDAVPHAEGSCLITQGKTRVLVTATVEGKVPPFLRDKGEGWITAEYGMLPRATLERTAREAVRGRQAGRTQEIQRLIGRALRGVVDRRLMPDRTVTLDCDVLVADAGTRCASVTGAYVALTLALAKLFREGELRANPLREAVAAVSVGLSGPDGGGGRRVLLDLDYAEDSTADVDVNVVATSGGRFVEVQGTAEREPFDEKALRELLAAARMGLRELFAAQRAALTGRIPDEWLLALQLPSRKSRRVSATRRGSSSIG